MTVAQHLLTMCHGLSQYSSNSARAGWLHFRVPGGQGLSLLFLLSHVLMSWISEKNWVAGSTGELSLWRRPLALAALLHADEQTWTAAPKLACSLRTRPPRSCRQVLGCYGKCEEQLKTSPGNTWSWQLEGSQSHKVVLSPQSQGSHQGSPRSQVPS